MFKGLCLTLISLALKKLNLFLTSVWLGFNTYDSGICWLLLAVLEIHPAFETYPSLESQYFRENYYSLVVSKAFERV